jgi:subtilisin family serine protease
MRLQKVSTSFFRVFAMLMVVTLAFSQLAGIAQAQGQPPEREIPTREKPDFDRASLDGVEGYYGPLGDVQGSLGIVIELEDTPSALVYAENQGKPVAQLAALTRTQTSMILGKQTDLMQSLKQQGIKATELYRTQKVFNGIWLKVDSADIQKLSQIAGIKAIYPMIPKELDHTTSVPLIGALQAWAGSGDFQGQNIKVGVIDTGIDYQHTMFGGSASSTFPTAKVVGGYDFAGDGYNGNSVPTPDPDPMDCNGHGSHVSGTVAGFGVLPDGSTFVEGVGDTYADLAALSPAAYQAKFRIGPGVAPKAELYGLRIFGCAGSTNLTEQAIEWAMDPNDDGDLSDHLDVINMSLGSSYGSEYDTSALASNNAVAAGVIVVASAGNSGDVFYITGSPGLAKYAISVASSQDSSTAWSAFQVTANTAAAPAAPVGNYLAGNASFGPTTFDVTGNLALTTPTNGCTAISQDLTGKIAVIDRGVCNFSDKAKNAQLKGAIGVLIVNDRAGFPPGLGGADATVTIPTMSTSQADGTSLKADIAAGIVTVRLNSAASSLALDPSLEDVVSSFSSRGPARGSYLKPDLTAPGDTINSVQVGSGDGNLSISGTSMAAPHVAGMMALLKQANPTWSVFELKALAMNTATNDVFPTTAKTIPLTPSRQGAGRVDIVNALNSQVVAYLKNDPGQVSLSFGAVAVSNVQSFSKVVEVKNTSASAITYDLAMVERYQPNAGLVFSLSAPSITVPAGGAAQFTVTVDVDAFALVKAIDPTISTTSTEDGRQRMSEGGGFVLLESTGTEPDLRVPVHIAARAATAMGLIETKLSLPTAATGILELTPDGTDAPYYASNVPLVAIMELMGQSPNEASSALTLDAADLKYVGVSYYSDANPLNETIYFGIATYGMWDTPNAYGGPEFDIYIDVDEDGVDDFLVFNADSGLGTTTRSDTMRAWVMNLSDGSLISNAYLNDVSGNTDTNVFNNNVLLIPVYVDDLGWDTTTNPDFNFTVQTFHRDGIGVVDAMLTPMSYDVANQAFDAGGWFMIDSPYTGIFEVAYDKDVIAERGSQGLLLLHMHNAADTAEVLYLDTLVSITRATASQFTSASSVDFDVVFTEPTAGVDVADFGVTADPSLTGATVTNVSGLPGSTSYVVTVSGYTGNGMSRLDILPSATMTDVNGAPVVGGYTGGESYIIIAAPTDISLSNTSVFEGLPAGTVVGTFTTTDPDAGDTFTYSLVAGAGDTDNAAFTIDGAVLKTAQSFDFSVKNSYSIRVRTTDSGSLTYEEVFIISIIEAIPPNQAPTNISLSNASVAEGQPAGTVVGSFATTDADAGDTFTYSLVTGTGDTDNAAFTIDGTALKTTQSFDFSVKNSYSVRVRSTDSGSLSFEKTFTISIIEVKPPNQAPTDISLSNTSVAEGQPAGTVVGTFTTADPDEGETFTYSLVVGTGDTDNAAFTIDGAVLKTTQSFDFSVKNSYSIRVRTTDSGGLTYDEVFTVSIIEIIPPNQAPTNISLSNTSIAEGQPAGTVVGTFTTADPDEGETFTYSLVAGAGDTDNAAFAINGAVLKTAQPFNYLTQNSYSIRVRTTDSGSLSFEKTFAISVTDAGPIFADVPDTFWAVSFIERLYNSGVTGGCGISPLIYCPENSVTREQMAVFLLKAKHGVGFVPPAATGLVFTDVPTTNIFAPWIEALAAEGITGGCGPQLYCPTATVTRAQMAVFLLKSKYGADYTPPVATGVFTDVPTINIFAPWIEQLAVEGITSGCGGGNYCPENSVTRAEMAVFIVKAFNLP